MPAVGQHFRVHQRDLSLGWEQVHAGALRRAQLGAAYALSAHATVSREPALIVLPTGVGKTLLVCLAPYLLGVKRVLVVAPGKLVRAQIVAAFETLQDLRSAGVVAMDMPAPNVKRVEHGANQRDWALWRAADVVVGTPNVLSNGYPDIERIPKGMFDLVVFDEAHHLPAKVWTAILEAVDAPAVLLTATPSRRDGKPLPGELVYTYPLSQAIKDGVYSPVRFLSVTVPPGGDPDQALAVAAAARLAAPEHAAAGSRLLVRTGTRVEARRLVDVYAAAGVDVGVVLGDTSPTQVRRILRQVAEGTLQGFVAVGAMIEGFDFPTLKVATYHHPHRSLAPMIQFLGRLSRAVPQGIRGELLAIPSAVEGETRELYRQDRDWAELMPEIVDAAHRDERTVRRYMASAHVSGPLDLAARALTPPKSARIYRVIDGFVPTLDVEPDQVGHGAVVFRFFDSRTALVAFVSHRVASQRWARTRLLDVAEFELHIATWIAEQHLLFVSTESVPALRDLLDYFGVAGACRNLAPDDLVRLVQAADPGNYFSVGLRAAQARRAQGASYDMTAGRAVESALSYNERSNTILGHLMAKPRSGDRGTVGFSVAKSKLWEPDNAQSLLDFRRWAEARAAELARPSAGDSLPRLDVQLGQQIATFSAEIIGATLEYTWLNGEIVVRVNGSLVPPDSLEVLARREDDDNVELILAVGENLVWRGHQRVDGSVIELEKQAVQVADGASGELLEMADALREAPLTLFLSDGSSVFGNLRVPPRQTPSRLPDDLLLSDDWQGTDITQELGAARSVQARTAELAAEGSDWVATDHGSGELADFIAISVSPRTAILRLYHCKGSGGPNPGRRVKDLYEVVGQCIKCIPWTLLPNSLISELLRRSASRKAFHVITGDAADLATQLNDLLQTPRTVQIEVIAVQPGVSVSDVPNWHKGRALLHAAAEWCSDGNTQFRFVGSR